MAKLPYETIAPQAEQLIDKAVLAATSGKPTEEVVSLYMDYKNYLEACGWTMREYDQEQLSRIDTTWEDPNQN